MLTNVNYTFSLESKDTENLGSVNSKLFKDRVWTVPNHTSNLGQESLEMAEQTQKFFALPPSQLS